MKRLPFVLLMMTCSVSWAEWEISANFDNGETGYHDRATIRRNGAIAKMWIMHDYPVVQTDNGDRYKSDKVQFAYDCRSETFVLISSIRYSDSMGAGDVVYSSTRTESQWKWRPIVPESVGELRWKIACGKK
jgi:hypothetical protein